MKITRFTMLASIALTATVAATTIYGQENNLPEPPPFEVPEPPPFAVPEPPAPFVWEPLQGFGPAAEGAEAPVLRVDGIGVDADEIRFDRNAGLVEAQGSVTLTVPSARAGYRAWQTETVFQRGAARTIQADRVTINRDEGVIEASGNVRVVESGNDGLTLEAPSMTVRYPKPTAAVVEVQ